MGYRCVAGGAVGLRAHAAVGQTARVAADQLPGDEAVGAADRGAGGCCLRQMDAARHRAVWERAPEE
eukprot:ctg_3737.g806